MGAPFYSAKRGIHNQNPPHVGLVTWKLAEAGNGLDANPAELSGP